MKLKLSTEIRVWGVYFLVLLLAIFTHEVGHCIPAWMEGVVAIPTPSKEYIMNTISIDLQQKVSLGGIIGTTLFSILVMVFYLTKNNKYKSAILAGAVAMPAMYSFRFLLVGRGHDATEFQEAQAALGLNYSGHSVDWLLFVLFLAGVAVWVVKTKPGFKMTGRWALGFIATLIFVVALQTINNAIFNPIFQS